MARSKFEIRAQKMLEEAGWEIDWKLRPRFANSAYNTDYFNKFDLMAHRGSQLRLISVKPASNCPTKHQKDIADFKLPQGVSKEIWRFDRDPKNKTKIRCRVWVFRDGERIKGEV